MKSERRPTDLHYNADFMGRSLSRACWDGHHGGRVRGWNDTNVGCEGWRDDKELRCECPCHDPRPARIKKQAPDYPSIGDVAGYIEIK